MNKKILLIVISGILSMQSIAQDAKFDWAKSISGTGNKKVYSTVLDDSGNIYITGEYSGTADFDPGSGTYNLISVGTWDMFICKLNTDGDFIWAKSIGGTSIAGPTCIALDNLGNIYTTGYFAGTTDFDPGASAFNLIATGARDIFVCKLTNSGNFVWAKKMGGINMDEGAYLSVDNSGNVFVTGHFYDIVDFDPGPGTFNLSAFSGYEIFILKLNSSGNFSWALKMTGTVQDYPLAIALDAAGNIYTTGYFMGTADFDPGAGVSNLTSFGNQDVFLSKLNSSGTFLWVKQFGGASDERGTSISTDALGFVYLGGIFDATADFDPGVGIFNLAPVHFGRNIYVCKLDDAGTFIWAKPFGGNINDPWHLDRMVVDPQQNIYATGDFGGTRDFDPGVDTFNLTANYNTPFISEFDSSGTFKYATQIPAGTASKTGFTIDLDPDENIVIAGDFAGTSDFDPSAGIFNLTSISSSDIFITKIHICWPTSSVINEVTCDKYVSPSGKYTWSISGTYHDTVLNAAGCDSIISINLTNNSPDTSITKSGSTLTSNAAGAVYRWLDCNNAFASVNGETNQNYTTTTSGYYAVEVTKNACVDTSLCFTICLPTSSVINDVTCNNYVSPSGKYTWNISGAYRDTVLNTAGCDSIISINLSNNSPDTSVTRSGSTLTSNAIGATYHWLDCNNGFSFISNELSQNYTAGTNGNYAVEVTQNGCIDTSSCFPLTSLFMIENNRPSFNAYPNPTTGEFFIELDKNNFDIVVNVSNVFGQIIYSKTYTPATKIQIQLEGNKGVYFVELQSNDRKSKRIMVLKN